MYLTTSPRLLRWLMPRGLIWEFPEKEKVLYLTFDDGPVPGVTDIALEILDKFNVKATFFCVGDNVRKYPDVYRSIATAGHSVGNHTFHHLNGWRATTEQYVDDVKHCNEYVNSKLFRPPYGRITREQAKALSQEYDIIMWSLLSGDFDPKITPERCLQQVTQYSKPGSIVVMHDGEKAEKTMLQILPRVLASFTEKGFVFKKISMVP